MEKRIIQQQLKIQPRSTAKAAIGNLILSLKTCDDAKANLVIGAPGLPNLQKTLNFGDATLYETPESGLIEVRLIATTYSVIEVLLTQVSPRLGFTAGLDSTDVENSPLLSDEIERVREGLQTVVVKLARREDITPEQLDLVQRKLDEILSASGRMGRKDWLMFISGTLTNIVVGAAFAPNAAKALFVEMNQSLGWLFHNALRLAL